MVDRVIRAKPLAALPTSRSPVKFHVLPSDIRNCEPEKPVLPGLAVVREMLGNQVLARAVDGLAAGVKRGAGLAQPMSNSGPSARTSIRSWRPSA